MTEKKTKFKDKLSAFKQKLLTFFKKFDTPFTRKICAWFSNHRYPIFAMLIAMGIMIVIYACIGVYPFGRNSILTLDMSGQYISFFEQMRDIFTGNGSLVYTFERTLGGEFLGIYDYYAASPITLIFLLFPQRAMVEAVTVMMILKVGISSLSFFIYLDATREKKDYKAFIMFSVMYAFCAYAMAYQSNTMWMDALMWLPLLTLGIERLVTHKKFKLFTIMLALIIWSNYYIGYMMCFYVLFYFICFISAHRTKKINHFGEKKHILKSFVRIGVCTIVALLIASMVLLTAYYSLTFGKNEFQNTKIDFSFRFDFIDFLSKFFLGSYDTVRPDGLPNVYCGMLMLFMLPLYFVSKKVTARHKIGYGILCTVFVLCFSINAFDLMFHGFQMPVWLNYRYSFVLSFLLLTMAYRGYEALSDIDYKFVFQTGVALLFLLFVIQKVADFPRTKLDVEGNEILFTLEMFVSSAIMIGVYLAVLYFRKKGGAKKVASWVLFSFVLFEACLSGVINWAEELNDVGLAGRNYYRNFIDRYEPTVDAILESDESFYRMEKGPSRKPNDNFSIDLRGMSSSTSTLNTKVVAFSDKIGYAAASHWSKYFSGNEISDSLLGIKYVVSDDANPVSSTFIPTPSSDGLTVYRNPYVLPIAYCVDNGLKSAVSSMPSPIAYNEHILSLMVGKSSEKYFTRCNVVQRSNNTFSVDPVTDGTVYMYVLSQRTRPPKATYYINNSENKSTYFDLENWRIKNIGSYNADEDFTISFTFDSSTNYTISKNDVIFVQIKEDVFANDIALLADGGLNITDFSDTHFEGTINAKENQFVFTSIPYDKYWKVKIDGETVETFETLDALLAFDITPGEHTISMTYLSTPFILGSCLSLLGVGIFIAMCILEKKFVLKKKTCDKQNDDTEDDKVDEVSDEIQNKTDECEKNDEKEVEQNDISC